MKAAPATIQFIAATPQFAVPDVVKAAEHWRDVLGFEISGYWDGERVVHSPTTPPFFAIVRRGDVQVFFNRAETGDARRPRAEGGYDAYFQVSGIDALAAELRGRAARIVEGPEDRVYGQRELVVEDCNGLILAFGEETRS